MARVSAPHGHIEVVSTRQVLVLGKGEYQGGSRRGWR